MGQAGIIVISGARSGPLCGDLTENASCDDRGLAAGFGARDVDNGGLLDQRGILGYNKLVRQVDPRITCPKALWVNLRITGCRIVREGRLFYCNAAET